MKHKQEHITYPNLPLAIYRELAAHLRQIEGVSTQLIPQKSQQFDYAQSQIDHLEMSYSVELSSQEKQRLEEILNYYAQIHGTYQRQVSDSP
ncbi:MAG: hypothetical protein WBM62_12035 [Crocosphaera sp.]